MRKEKKKNLDALLLLCVDIIFELAERRSDLVDVLAFESLDAHCVVFSFIRLNLTQFCTNIRCCLEAEHLPNDCSYWVHIRAELGLFDNPNVVEIIYIPRSELATGD